MTTNPFVQCEVRKKELLKNQQELEVLKKKIVEQEKLVKKCLELVEESKIDIVREQVAKQSWAYNRLRRLRASHLSLNAYASNFVSKYDHHHDLIYLSDEDRLTEGSCRCGDSD